jgi:hypothetical protein
MERKVFHLFTLLQSGLWYSKLLGTAACVECGIWRAEDKPGGKPEHSQRN